MENLNFNKDGATEIPEGYKWCEACKALTPYQKDDSWGSYRCKVCDDFSTGILECPKCGCDEGVDMCEPNIVTRHHKGCHEEYEETEFGFIYSHAEKLFREFKDDFMRKSSAPDRHMYCLPKDQEWYNKNKALHKMFKDYKSRTECNCPKFTVYSNINQIVNDSGKYFNGDYTEHWFRYKVRCRVCGFIYENSDST
jgi:hypothetical protein